MIVRRSIWRMSRKDDRGHGLAAKVIWKLRIRIAKWRLIRRSCRSLMPSRSRYVEWILLIQLRERSIHRLLLIIPPSVIVAFHFQPFLHFYFEIRIQGSTCLPIAQRIVKENQEIIGNDRRYVTVSWNIASLYAARSHHEIWKDTMCE